MVETIRNKWCDDMEEILQCPICMMVPIADIHQCPQGHIICNHCKTQVLACALCIGEWSCRNRVAEDLCKLLIQIKTSLIDEDEEFKKLLIADTVSSACQTDETQNASKAAETGPLPLGTYPCRINSCNIQLTFEPLMKHLATDHPNKFLELPQNGAVFEYSWIVEYHEQMTFDRAVRITDVGAFFLKLSTDAFGNFTGYVMMVHSATISKQYSYQLELNCGPEHSGSTYTGDVMTCRACPSGHPGKCLQVKRAEIQRMLGNERNLKCTLLITKPREKDEKQPQQASKTKHPKKRNKSAKPSRDNGQNEPEPRQRSPAVPGPSNGHISHCDLYHSRPSRRNSESSTSS